MVKHVHKKDRLHKWTAEKKFNIVDETLTGPNVAMDQMFCDNSVGRVIDRYILAQGVNGNETERERHHFFNDYPDLRDQFFTPMADGSFSKTAKLCGHGNTHEHDHSNGEH